MQENVGTIDRTIRSIVGPGLMLLGYQLWGGRRGAVAGLVAIAGGIALLESAITRVCPVNAMLGIDTRRLSQRSRDAVQHLVP